MANDYRLNSTWEEIDKAVKIFGSNFELKYDTTMTDEDVYEVTELNARDVLIRVIIPSRYYSDFTAYGYINKHGAYMPMCFKINPLMGKEEEQDIFIHIYIEGGILFTEFLEMPINSSTYPVSEYVSPMALKYKEVTYDGWGSIFTDYINSIYIDFDDAPENVSIMLYTLGG